MDRPMVGVFTPDGRCLSISAADGMLSELGLSRTCAVGRTIEEMCANPHAERWMAKVIRVYETGTSLHFPARWRFPAGRYRFDASVMPLRGIAQEISGVLIIADHWQPLDSTPDSTPHSKLATPGVSERGVKGLKSFI